MRCDYHEAGVCRSCTLLATPYDAQLAAKQEHARALLPGVGRWEPPVASPPEGFRNKAKLVVAGTVDAPTLGILSPDGHGVDLRECGLHEPGLRAVLPALADFVSTARLEPYDVPRRRGELKHLLLTRSPDEELMVRFVLRSTEALTRIRKHLPALRAALPMLRVATCNVQPEHKAVLEGEREIVLTPTSTLPLRLDRVTLHLQPRSFFQTNTEIARVLYATARSWAAVSPARTILDLYCGIGGFALHLAGPGRSVLGVEISPEAVESARTAAASAGLDARFEAGDAGLLAARLSVAPDLVVVNPPRRGIGADLADWLEGSGVPEVLYSSCHADSLAADLARMPSLSPVRGRVLDMFPQTRHYEVLVHLVRDRSATMEPAQPS